MCVRLCSGGFTDDLPDTGVQVEKNTCASSPTCHLLLTASQALVTSFFGVVDKGTAVKVLGCGRCL